MSRSSQTEGVLDRLMAGRAISGCGLAVVVAHPDDETLGLGAQLPLLSGITIVHVTDGAPRNLEDANRLGFETAQDYAQARRYELEAAMALAGIAPRALVGLAIPDQAAAHNLVDMARRLAALFAERAIGTVFTHAYEGGHPDHDATAFAVRAAATLAGRRAGAEIAVVEMPFYRASPEGWVVQQFLPDASRREVVLTLDERQRDLKARMFAAHASQAGVLDRFPIAVERFRIAPDYDFAKLPPVDELLYERQNWGLTGPRWIELVREAIRELGLGAAVTP
jgi:LmbE family N-acetylglucosaminyl deacetylase